MIFQRSRVGEGTFTSKDFGESFAVETSSQAANQSHWCHGSDVASVQLQKSWFGKWCEGKWLRAEDLADRADSWQLKSKLVQILPNLQQLIQNIPMFFGIFQFLSIFTHISALPAVFPSAPIPRFRPLQVFAPRRLGRRTSLGAREAHGGAEKTERRKELTRYNGFCWGDWLNGFCWGMVFLVQWYFLVFFWGGKVKSC